MKKHNMVSAYILEALILVPFVMLLLVTDDRRFAAFAVVTKPESCDALLLAGKRTSGEYVIWIDDATPTNVYCNMDIDSGGWTVIQRRIDASTDFYRGRSEYKQGFGNLSKNFWLGLDAIQKLTERGAVLRIDIAEIGGKKGFAKYSSFKIGDESSNYQLAISGYSGNAGDSLAYHNGMKFTTKDIEFDNWSGGNCAVFYKDGWWHDACRKSNLNGLYPNGRAYTMSWYHLSNQLDITNFSEMKIRVSSPSPKCCHQYQVLSEESRLATYYSQYKNQCDTHLNGWYRFMGKAGDRLLDSCPSTNDNLSNSCGSNWQGWLNDSNPNANEGEVYKRVCFSRYPRCHCEYEKIIKVKNCGYFYVYRLIGVPRCNQRYCGVQDKKLTVSCGSNYMRIDLDRRYYNASKYSSITLRDPTCKATFSNAYIILGSMPSLCGVVKEQTANQITYKNKVIMTMNQKSDLVSRDDDEEINFKCTYNRDGVASGVSFEPIRRVIGEETGIGKFTFELAMHRSQSYANQYSSYPVKVKLRDWLYFQATANTQDSSLILLIDQCYSTPNMDRNHHKKYYFINSRCPTDNTVRFHQADGQKQRFSIHAFKYFGQTTVVYVHCLIFLCHKTSSEYKCNSGCTGNNVNRVRREIKSGSEFGNNDGGYSNIYLLEAGPIELQSGDKTPAKGANQSKNVHGKSLLITSMTMVACLVVLVIVVVKMRHKRPVVPTHVTNEIGIDNNSMQTGADNIDQGGSIKGEEKGETTM